ncbi:MAG: T9SS type A sorting domain-containing protein [Bacteroidetes bacterium]|nr:T9SS type A sorting domain-containing protein [Bacteroidota bacterium]
MKLFFSLSFSLFCLILNAQCPPGDVSLLSQTDVDNFVATYPNCTTINGFLRIQGFSINNLSGLSNLTTINSNLQIELTNQLTSLNGLNNVTSVGGNLEVQTNFALTSLSSLSNLTSVGGDLMVSGNALTSLSGLNKLTSINGNLEVSANNPLTSLSGLDSLTSINGYLEIRSNNALTSLNGLDSLTSIGGYLEVRINNVLTSLNGLDSLTSIGGYLEVRNNNALTSLSGLNSVTSIGGYLQVRSNNALTSLSGLNDVTSIGGLWMQDNAALTSLNGLNSLISVSGSLDVQNNDALTSLSNLNNLTSVSGGLFVTSNDALTSLSGLDNIDYSTINYVTITSNPNLIICEVQSICDYLASPSNPALISGNATGCNSRTEVENACMALPVEFINFGASLLENGVNLHWQTASETNNQGFYLQKTKNGKEWNNLAFIEGQGNSILYQNYHFTDIEPYNGLNYYRLKQVDFDGSFEYSKIVSIRFDTNSGELIIFPNPANEILNIHSPTQIEGIVTVEVKDVNGHILIREEFNTTKFQVNVSTLPNGVYFVQVNNRNPKMFIKY